MARPTSASPTSVDRAHAPIVRALRWLRDRVHGLYTALGLFLTIALVLAFGAIWIFAKLASGVMAGATLSFDDTVLEWLHRHASAGWDQVALQITAVGNGTSVAVISLVVCAFLWAFRQRGAVLLLIMAVVGADLGQTLLKLVFQRPRPELFVIQTPYARPVSTSFPSGHAMGAIALYLVLAYLLDRLGGSRPFRWITNLAAALLIVGIGASRVYLGVHYPSDVAAGYLVGFVWVTLCVFAIESVGIIRKRSRRVEDQVKPAVPGGEDLAGPPPRSALR
jgi:undecaprenyl-diphosphatase